MFRLFELLLCVKHVALHNTTITSKTKCYVSHCVANVLTTILHNDNRNVRSLFGDSA